jgi:hypothetical protein
MSIIRIKATFFAILLRPNSPIKTSQIVGQFSLSDCCVRLPMPDKESHAFKIRQTMIISSGFLMALKGRFNADH